MGGRGRCVTARRAPVDLDALREARARIEPQLDPLDAVQVQVTAVSAAGGTSVTSAPTASSGPAFVTTIVYVSGSPGIAPAWPSVFVTPSSVCATSGVSVTAQNPPATRYGLPARYPASGCPIVPPSVNEPPALTVTPPPSTVCQLRS